MCIIIKLPLHPAAKAAGFTHLYMGVITRDGQEVRAVCSTREALVEWMERTC